MKNANSLVVKISMWLLAMTIFAGSVLAQTVKSDLGQREFEASCAGCHGNDGKGNGPYLELLGRIPPDLTTLTKNNGGTFPVSRMYQTIEGANVPSHGSRKMPIWGRTYRISAAEHYVDVDYNPEVFVRTRILALIEYLSRIQER